MNIDISEINKNTLKFMEILCKGVKMTLIIKLHIDITLKWSFKTKMKIDVALLQHLTKGSHLGEDITHTKT